jgi:hypothetical protein
LRDGVGFFSTWRGARGGLCLFFLATDGVFRCVFVEVKS